MTDLKERLLYTHEHGLFDAISAGMLASRKEAADRIEALEAELAARDGWQPIETAPMDGTRIEAAHIGWCYSSEAIKKWPGDLDPKDEYRVFWVSSAKYDAARDRWTDGLDALMPPTHWKHLHTPVPTSGPNGCDVPPDGWYCTRQRGHDGSCAAIALAAIAAAKGE